MSTLEGIGQEVDRILTPKSRDAWALMPGLYQCHVRHLGTEMVLSLRWVRTNGAEIRYWVFRKRCHTESEILANGRHEAGVEDLTHTRRLWSDGVTHMVGDCVLQGRRRIIGRKIGGAEEGTDGVGWHGTRRQGSLGFGYVRDLGWGPRPTDGRGAGVGLEVLQVWLEGEEEETAGYLPEHFARDKHVGPRLVRVIEGSANRGIGAGYETHAFEFWYEIPPAQDAVLLDANLPVTTRAAGGGRGLGSLGV